MKVSASQKATLSCEVSDLKTEVKWFKDGKQLISSKTVHMESKGKSRQLVLENVEKKDTGEYTCDVGNEKLLFKIQVEGKIFLHINWLPWIHILVFLQNMVTIKWLFPILFLRCFYQIPEDIRNKRNCDGWVNRKGCFKNRGDVREL